MEHFPERFGYPPDSNVVVTRSLSERQLTGRGHGDADLLPADVLAFFDVVEEVSLPDVWNGYFLGPAHRVLGQDTDRDLRWIQTRGGRTEIVVVGSDGGGALYVVSVEGGSVMRVEEGAVRDGVVEVVRDEQIHQLASSFADFLELVAADLESFAAGTSTPTF